MSFKIFIFFYFLVFNIFYNLSFTDFDQNEEENKISIILGKGDQLNYESNGFIWSPKFKYSSFSKLDIGKGYNVKFNYGLKFDKFGIKLDSTNLNFDFHKLNLVVGIYRNIISQTRVAGMTYLIKPCNYFNFFVGLEMHRRTKYLLDKNNVEEWKERKYGTELKDFATIKEEGENDVPIRYGRFSQVPWSPNFSAGIILKDKNDKINFCLGGIFAPFLIYAYEEFDQTARKMHLSARFLLKKIIHGWLDKLEISFFYNNILGEYSKYHNPQKFKINEKDFILPVSFVFSENNNETLRLKKIGANIKTVHNITKNISFSFNISFLHYLEPENKIFANLFLSNKKQEIKKLVDNVFYTNLNFKWNIPRVRFIQLSGGIGFGILNNYDEDLKPIFSLKNGNLFWNARVGFGILIDKLIQRESFEVFKAKDFNILDVLNIGNINCGLKINQTMDYGRNPYEYYRRGFSHPLELHPYCDIIFIANSKNKIVLELCGNFNNKMGHGWEKENWIFKCVDKLNFKWENDGVLIFFAGFGESVVNDFTKVWRLGIKHKISKIVSLEMDIEKPRKSWKIQREISIINEDRIKNNTPQKCLLDINDYKNCDDSFLTGLKHPGFSFSFNFNFKKDILMKIGTMWKPFNENKDDMTDTYDCVKGIVYFETQVKGFSFKCTLNRAAGCYTQIENCNINCHGTGFIPTEFCIGPDCYYQNSIFKKDTRTWKYIDKNALPKDRSLNFTYEENNNPYLAENSEEKLKYITTIDFQLMYSFKIFKKRKDTIFLRLNYLHCFTKYDRVIMFLEKEEDIENITLKKFYEDNFFKGGVRDDLIYLILGTNIFIKPFLKIFVEFSFGFLHGLFNKDKNNIIQQCKKCPDSIKTQGINVPKICYPFIIWNCQNSLWGMKIGFECDLGKKYCSDKPQTSLLK